MIAVQREIFNCRLTEILKLPFNGNFKITVQRKISKLSSDGNLKIFRLNENLRIIKISTDYHLHGISRKFRSPETCALQANILYPSCPLRVTTLNTSCPMRATSTHPTRPQRVRTLQFGWTMQKNDNQYYWWTTYTAIAL